VRKFPQNPPFLLISSDFSHQEAFENSGVRKSLIFSHPQIYFNPTAKPAQSATNLKPISTPILNQSQANSNHQSSTNLKPISNHTSSTNKEKLANCTLFIALSDNL